MFEHILFGPSYSRRSDGVKCLGHGHEVHQTSLFGALNRNRIA